MAPQLPQPSEGLNAAVAAELRAAQGRLKMAVKALAEAADIPYGTLRRYLAAERYIDVAVLEQLATALGTTAADLVREAQLRTAGATIHPFPSPAASPSDLPPTVTDEDLIGLPSVAEPEREDVEGEADPEDT